MNEYLLIDGYNIINAWKDVFDLKNQPLEDSRDKLLEIISNYQGYKQITVMVVFDAHKVKGAKEIIEQYDNIFVVYTKENETADQYIERFVYSKTEEDKVYVVTSDYLEQRIVLGGGGIRITPRELKAELLSEAKVDKYTASKANNRNILMSNLDKKTLEKLEKIRRS